MKTAIILLYHLLTWSDFKGAADPNSPHVVAHTECGMDLVHRVGGQWVAKTTFYANESWSITDDPYKLAHEQGHLDLNEIFVRKCNKALAYVKSENDAWDTLATYFNLCETQQELYDRQTQHSRNRQMQAIWANKINKALNAH